MKGRPIDRATLLNLGTYTAGGLPLQFPEDVGSDDAALAYFGAWKPDAAPGTVRQYSSRFAKLIESQLLPKFGMRDTYVHVPPRAMADYAWVIARIGRSE